MIAQSLGGMEIVVGMSLLARGLVLDKSELVQGSKLPINYFFTSTAMPLTVEQAQSIFYTIQQYSNLTK